MVEQVSFEQYTVDSRTPPFVADLFSAEVPLVNGTFIRTIDTMPILSAILNNPEIFPLTPNARRIAAALNESSWDAWPRIVIDVDGTGTDIPFVEMTSEGPIATGKSFSLVSKGIIYDGRVYQNSSTSLEDSTPELPRSLQDLDSVIRLTTGTSLQKSLPIIHERWITTGTDEPFADFLGRIFQTRYPELINWEKIADYAGTLYYSIQTTRQDNLQLTENLELPEYLSPYEGESILEFIEREFVALMQDRVERMLSTRSLARAFQTGEGKVREMIAQLPIEIQQFREKFMITRNITFDMSEAPIRRTIDAVFEQGKSPTVAAIVEAIGCSPTQFANEVTPETRNLIEERKGVHSYLLRGLEAAKIHKMYMEAFNKIVNGGDISEWPTYATIAEQMGYSGSTNKVSRLIPLLPEEMQRLIEDVRKYLSARREQIAVKDPDHKKKKADTAHRNRRSQTSTVIEGVRYDSAAEALFEKFILHVLSQGGGEFVLKRQFRIGTREVDIFVTKRLEDGSEQFMIFDLHAEYWGINKQEKLNQIQEAIVNDPRFNKCDILVCVISDQDTEQEIRNQLETALQGKLTLHQVHSLYRQFFKLSKREILSLLGRITSVFEFVPNDLAVQK